MDYLVFNPSSAAVRHLIYKMKLKARKNDKQEAKDRDRKNP